MGRAPEGSGDGASSKTLYERMMHEPNQWVIVECEYSETATEAAWLEAFRNDGYTILNDTGCNARKPKRSRGDAERDWIELNDAAERRVLAAMDPEVLAAEPAEHSTVAKEWDALLKAQWESWHKTRNWT